MFLDKALDEIGRKNKIVIGLDLTNDYVQISYCRLDQSMPDTVSLVMGEEQYNIPAVLCRKHQQEGQRRAHAKYAEGSPEVTDLPTQWPEQSCLYGQSHASGNDDKNQY